MKILIYPDGKLTIRLSLQDAIAAANKGQIELIGQLERHDTAGSLSGAPSHSAELASTKGSMLELRIKEAWGA
jgi:hypothetical protein